VEVVTSITRKEERGGGDKTANEAKVKGKKRRMKNETKGILLEKGERRLGGSAEEKGKTLKKNSGNLATCY